jgi:hypothetical protein
MPYNLDLSHNKPALAYARKLLDNLHQLPYNKVVDVLGLKFIFNLVLSDKSTI